MIMKPPRILDFPILLGALSLALSSGFSRPALAQEEEPLEPALALSREAPARGSTTTKGGQCPENCPGANYAARAQALSIKMVTAYTYDVDREVANKVYVRFSNLAGNEADCSATTFGWSRNTPEASAHGDVDTGEVTLDPGQTVEVEVPVFKPIGQTHRFLTDYWVADRRAKRHCRYTLDIVGPDGVVVKTLDHYRADSPVTESGIRFRSRPTVNAETPGQAEEKKPYRIFSAPAPSAGSSTSPSTSPSTSKDPNSL
jgi:hypothetical protein